MPNVPPTNAEIAEGLRQVADFLDAHPDLPSPMPKLRIYCTYNRDAIERAAAELEPSEMRDGSGTYSVDLVRHFGAVELALVAERALIGDEREVTTTQFVPRPIEEIVAAGRAQQVSA